MGNLKDTAEIVKDLYYQNYRSAGQDFFNEQHFMYLCGVAHSKILEDEYKEARREAKAEEGYTSVFLQEDWHIEEEVKLERMDGNLYEGKLDKAVFVFPFDPYYSGLQSITAPAGMKCRDFVRASPRDSWMNCHLSSTKKSFFAIRKGILSITSYCPLEKVSVMMIPNITDISFGEDGGPVPSSKEELIIRKTLDLMIQARQGVIVDTSNNGNPNKTMQTEVDTAFGNLKTKPI